jgi:flagellar assembly protein FliH
VGAIHTVMNCRTQDEILEFQYAAMPYTPVVPALFGTEETVREALCTQDANTEGNSAAAIDSEVIAEEARRAFSAGREQGLQEGRRIEHEAQTTAIKETDEQRKRQVLELIDQFAGQRDHYMHRVEQEVVKLALAVAARILRREAHMDPLLLTGAVRVALGQISDATVVRLRVPGGELGLWKDAIALLPNLAIKPELLAGEGMRLGDCVIETDIGSVDLGVRAQLGEIERGFFDSTTGATRTLANQAVAGSAGTRP